MLIKVMKISCCFYFFCSVILAQNDVDHSVGRDISVFFKEPKQVVAYESIFPELSAKTVRIREGGIVLDGDGFRLFLMLDSSQSESKLTRLNESYGVYFICIDTGSGAFIEGYEKFQNKMVRRGFVGEGAKGFHP
ncbi:hypothetical protein AAFN60_07755 [Roseibacillus persicicus]|uniref:hypothetical protein n=1 Tax=Roseibacillus persicicus TaxID=454148 RepID=UPI00398A9064